MVSILNCTTAYALARKGICTTASVVGYELISTIRKSLLHQQSAWSTTWPMLSRQRRQTMLTVEPEADIRNRWVDIRMGICSGRRETGGPHERSRGLWQYEKLGIWIDCGMLKCCCVVDICGRRAGGRWGCATERSLGFAPASPP